MKVIAKQFVDNDWGYSDADTGYLTHSIHRYSGKFIPQIASRAITLLTKPGDLVVDPYCGSGTTLLEAAMHGRRAIGVDLNPLAILISSVKTTPMADLDIQKFIAKFERVVHSQAPDDLFKEPLPKSISEDWRLYDAWFQKWFQPDVLLDLVHLHHLIMKVRMEHLRNIALLAFSESLRRVSNAHQGYPNVMFDKRAVRRPRPGKIFLKNLRQICSAVAALPQGGVLREVRAVHGDARQLPFDPGVADAVISHPPYVGSIPYAEYGALSLKWLGCDPKALDRQLTGGQRQSKTVFDRFDADYRLMIRESYRVIRKGGYLFLMVGNPTIRGQVVDLAQVTGRHATEAGFISVATASRSGENRRANKMGSETLLLYRKS